MQTINSLWRSRILQTLSIKISLPFGKCTLKTEFEEKNMMPSFGTHIGLQKSEPFCNSFINDVKLLLSNNKTKKPNKQIFQVLFFRIIFEFSVIKHRRVTITHVVKSSAKWKNLIENACKTVSRTKSILESENRRKNSVSSAVHVRYL